MNEHETKSWYVGRIVTLGGQAWEIFDVQPVTSPLHTPEKPVFFTRMRLITLVKVDTDVQDAMYACTECDNLYESVGVLRVHLNKDHGNGMIGKRGPSRAPVDPLDLSVGQLLEIAGEVVELRVEVDQLGKENAKLNERVIEWRGRAKTAEKDLSTLRGALRGAMGEK